jgi:predicted nuclease of restriction endonuclease-like (RecB) superfamily
VAKSSLVPDEGSYTNFLEDLKTRIRAAQVKAALAVNRELLLLYWQVGREILARQQSEGWGTKVLDRLTRDLKREFPDMKGFSRSNLKYMRSFAEAWPDGIGQAPLGQITWYHNIALLEKLKEPQERLWYARETIANGWSRNVLVAQIKTGLYQRGGEAVNNFARTLPAPQSDLAKQIVRDPYNFDFLTLSKEVEEHELKRALVKHMRDFLLELGVGFAFIGHNYPLTVGDQDFQIDLLFYHLELRCFVVIELEMGDFKPEYSGMMNFYIAAIDDQNRKEYDQPTIGIILCQTRQRAIAEYALSNLRNPIAVAEHRWPEGSPDALPSPEQLESELENAVRQLESETEDTL